MELKDVADGSKYSTTTTEPLYSAVNKGLKEEVVAQGNGSAVVETRVVEEELNTEEVIVSQAPPTHQAEMETQELVKTDQTEPYLCFLLKNVFVF